MYFKRPTPRAAVRPKTAPRPPTANPFAMQAEAAQMGADAMNAQPGPNANPVPAPVVPTTNLKLPKPVSRPGPTATQMPAGGAGIPTRQAPLSESDGVSTAVASGPPSTQGATGTSSGQAINVTGDPRAHQAARDAAVAAAKMKHKERANLYPVDQAMEMPLENDDDATPPDAVYDDTAEKREKAKKKAQEEARKRKAQRDNAPPAWQTTEMGTLYEDAIRRLLGEGPRDTKADEELIRQQMLRDAGAGQADLNARMGAAGFGTSGALGAMTTDLRSRAALDASKAIAGVQQSARDEYLDRLAMGLRGSNEAAQMELKQQQFQALEAAIKQMQEDSAAANTPGSSYLEDRQSVNDVRDTGEDPFGLLGSAANTINDIAGDKLWKEMDAQNADALVAAGAKLTKDTGPASLTGNVWKDQYGNLYTMPAGWSPKR